MREDDVTVCVVGFHRPVHLGRVLRAVAAFWEGRVQVYIDRCAEECAEWQETVSLARSMSTSNQWTTEVAAEPLGVAEACPTAINGALEETEAVIVLEDDCMPGPSFISFASAMLHRFVGDESIMHISGNTFGRRFPFAGGIGVSKLAQVWGWATWRSAWRYYDRTPRVASDALAQEIDWLRLDQPQARVYTDRLNLVVENPTYTWDFQWHHAIAKRRGLAIVPDVNLISNTGFGAMATHTRRASHPHANLPTEGWKPRVADETLLDVTSWYAHSMLDAPSWSRQLTRRMRPKFTSFE